MCGDDVVPPPAEVPDPVQYDAQISRGSMLAGVAAVALLPREWLTPRTAEAAAQSA
jgi:hypothetical protein